VPTEAEAPGFKSKVKIPYATRLNETQRPCFYFLLF
jgi:hypothetical protein